MQIISVYFLAIPNDSFVLVFFVPVDRFSFCVCVCFVSHSFLDEYAILFNQSSNVCNKQKKKKKQKKTALSVEKYIKNKSIRNENDLYALHCDKVAYASVRVRGNGKLFFIGSTTLGEKMRHFEIYSFIPNIRG